MVRDLLSACGNISVHVIAGEEAAGEPVPKKTVRTAERQEPFDPKPYIFALLAVGTAVGVSELLWPWIGTQNTDLVFLTAIVAIAVGFGLWPSLLASVVSALCYNFFFTEPYHTLLDRRSKKRRRRCLLHHRGDHRFQCRCACPHPRGHGHGPGAHHRGALRLQSQTRRRRDPRRFALGDRIPDGLDAEGPVVLLLPENGSIVVKAGYPPEDILDKADLAAANWAWEHDRSAGRGSDTLPGAKRLFLPMRTGRGAIGVVGIDSDKPGPLLTPDQRRLLDALIDQAALAIERVNLVDDLDEAKRRAEADRLRAALLTSISHDLKTPLAAIVGAAGALKDLSSQLDDKAKADLVATILDESERLNRFIANLLDMTKLEAGSIKPNMARHDVSEIVGSVLERARKILARHTVEIEIADGLPMLELDPVLFEQVLFNLLDNAAKYAPPETTIRIESWQERETVKLQVIDEGSGIPPEEVELVFEKFHRASKGDQIRAGTGLGLAISRGFIEAMGGTIDAANRSDRPGAVFTINLPVPKASERLDTAA